MRAVIILALLLALSVLGYWYLGGAGGESSGDGSVTTTGDGSGGSTVTTSDESSASEVDVTQPNAPRRIDYRCTLEGHLHLGGGPAGRWQFRMSGVTYKGTGAEFEWSSPKPMPVHWVADDLAAGHARMSFFHDMVLVPGLNRLDIDLPVGTLELEGFPLPAEFSFGGTNDISVDLMLTWERSDGLRWQATLFTAEDGRLVIENVPAGLVRLRQFLPGDAAKTLAEARPILEIDVTAGERTRVRFPD